MPAFMSAEPDPMEDEPIVDEDPHELPFLRMRWRNFERMNLRLAERVDRLRDAQAFGLRARSRMESTS
jgi:hypothetical protein